MLERSQADIPEGVWAVVAMGLGGLLFAGSLEDEDYFGTTGIVPGMVCALLGFLAARAFLGGAVDRLAARGEDTTTIVVLADLAVARDRGTGRAVAAHVLRLRCVLLLGAARPPPPRGAEVRRASHPAVNKLVLVFVDALKPAMLERAVAEGRAPAFAEILRRGTYYPDCVSVFPSVTPAASASITTGTMPDAHGVPSIYWYHRGERRYVDYGSSGAAVRTFGVLRALTDTVYNMNFDHLHRQRLTVFERLDDIGVRTACTPFLIFRGRTRHELGVQGWLRRVAQAANFRHPVYGPSELFYGELYSSQEVDCRPTLARPGTRDPYSGCVGAYVERHDLYDFMLFSLPDNDHHSHRFGPQATVESIARADRHLAELAEPAGGIERFLDDHAVILMSDHAQISVVRARSTWQVRSRTGGCCSPTTRSPTAQSWRSRPARGRRWSTCSGEEERFRARGRPAARSACRRSTAWRSSRGRTATGVRVDRARRAAVLARRGGARPARRRLGRRRTARDAGAWRPATGSRTAAPTRTRCGGSGPR